MRQSSSFCHQDLGSASQSLYFDSMQRLARIRASASSDGESARHAIPRVRIVKVPICHSDVEPHMSCNQILQDAVALFVHLTKGHLRKHRSLFRCLAKPLHRFSTIPNDAVAILVQLTKPELRSFIPPPPPSAAL
jgi:hypothetical protein